MSHPSTDGTNEHPQTTDDGSSPVTRFSSKSKRQRDGTENVGAFGSRTGHSDLIFLERILPENDGEILNRRSIENQMTAYFDELESVRSARDVDLTDVLKVTVQLTEAVDWDSADTVYQERFDGEYPPRTTVGVCSLPGDAAVQLDVIAADE
ncbi:RidA family protein [Natronorubrum thiooxidans]|uniref:2-iminobutanoate/2-iminopropanoate deaminase n=1 Tax=Natronorubrum thiooxidans TaxID=308853 RepID=A0A1N7H5H9_9EURY|nr:RidA family protein [Natronorubrum thiooxidans]SIS19918.1 2-iminobutanoate/2-iminopropanoate deaminase [Natronorubrum thiooxidans]